jgi:protein SCO1/2
MYVRTAVLGAVLGWLWAACGLASGTNQSGGASSALRSFAVQGVVKEIKPDGRTVIIQHEAIANYMDAMTMPFKAKVPGQLAALKSGDAIRFRLQVTESESWIDQIEKTGVGSLKPAGEAPRNPMPTPTEAGGRHPMLDFKFTNELGQATCINDYKGQALAITFFFTRCPVPDYCPRLSKNFAAASQKLAALPGGPTNWHFISVSFDTAFDTPPVLKAYGETYQYNPKHWSFWTGPADKIKDLAAASDAKFEPDEGFFTHNFRTLIVDARGHLQMMFPIGGDLSDAIVDEMRKAATATEGGESKSEEH